MGNKRQRNTLISLLCWWAFSQSTKVKESLLVNWFVLKPISRSCQGKQNKIAPSLPPPRPLAQGLDPSLGKRVPLLSQLLLISIPALPLSPTPSRITPNHRLIINNYWTRLSRSRRLRQIIDLRDTDKSWCFVITEFNNCLIIRSPSLFSYFNHFLTAQGSDLPFFSWERCFNYAGAEYYLEQNTFRRYYAWAEHYL